MRNEEKNRGSEKNKNKGRSNPSTSESSDEGQGSAGNLGSDGDHRKDKKQQLEGEDDHYSSPVPVKKAK